MSGSRVTCAESVPGEGVEPSRARAHGMLSCPTHVLGDPASSGFFLFPQVRGHLPSGEVRGDSELADATGSKSGSKIGGPGRRSEGRFHRRGDLIAHRGMRCW
jgi:hypothetical protein